MVDKGECEYEREEGYEDYSSGVMFTNDEGSIFLLTHRRDCCEDVTVERVDGCFADLEGSPIVLVDKECVVDKTHPYEVVTRTSFTFATANKSVCVTFYGHSYGCYAEDDELHLAAKLYLVVR